MKEVHESIPSPENNLGEGEHFASSLELKEIVSMFVERREELQTVLNIIEHELMAPKPNPSDYLAVEEYNAKMEMLQRLAEEYADRSSELKQMWQKIEMMKLSAQ